jgi:hypothetical protein
MASIGDRGLWSLRPVGAHHLRSANLTICVYGFSLLFDKEYRRVSLKSGTIYTTVGARFS